MPEALQSGEAGISVARNRISAEVSFFAATIQARQVPPAVPGGLVTQPI